MSGPTALLLAHVWSSTLFLALLLAAIAALRSHLTASGRFALAVIGMAKFAVPAMLIAPLLRTRAAAPPLVMPLRVLSGALPAEVAPAAAATWPVVALVVWAAVALALIVRFAVTRHRLVALAVRTATPPTPREAEALTRARRALGVRQSIDLARSPLPEAPAVLRIVRPLIVLPARGCDDLSDQELESLLRHECAHVARRDNLVARLESLVCALFWFHPLLWIAQRITAIERERACDEVVAASAAERETYLTALTKFCNAAIAPRLPGVSCMATARLKERMDHVMNFETLKLNAFSPKRAAMAAAAALVVFTVASAAPTKPHEPYAVRLEATKTDQAQDILLHAVITDNETAAVVAEPKVTLPVGTSTDLQYGGGLNVGLATRAAGGDRVGVDVTIRRDGRVVQSDTLTITLSMVKYTGDPISMDLKDADLRDVIMTFGKLTGMQIRIDAPVEGKVSVSWHNVPWDQAFDSLLNENGLAYHTEGKTIVITPK